ncbi:hypothetical protein DL93DRAFT_2167059 [Clavulina sp. PMI_390]|nr:hypothetical protein DL93DRAFT_2167059 [Clavulina sp. PMI_390]
MSDGLAEIKSAASKIVGPLVIGSFINLVLHGALLLQAQTFFRHSAKDPKWLKIFVASIIITETIQSIFSGWIAYYYSIVNFGIVENILTANYLFEIMISFCALSSSAVQVFFALRVHRLTKQRIIPALIIVAAIIELGCGVTTGTVGSFKIHKFTEFHKLSTVVIVWLSLGVASDIAITWALTNHLRTFKHSGFSATDDLISRITRLIIQTGLVTVIWAITDLILFVRISTNFHFIFTAPISKFYVNSMLSQLNARALWRADQRDAAQHWPTGTAIQVTTIVGVHHDTNEFVAHKVEPSKRLSVMGSNAAAPDVVLDIKTGYNHGSQDSDRTVVGDGNRTKRHSDGLSLNSEDLEREEEVKPTRRVDWRDML